MLKWIIEILQHWVSFVLLAQYPQFFGYLPINRQIRVAEQDPAIRLRMVQVIALVRKNRRLTQYRKTMRKTLGDEELQVVLCTQLDTVPLTESRTVLTQIYRDI